MKIGDRIYVRGYIDEIRKDTVIVRNDGGYFGTIPSEVITGELPSAQPEIIHCKECKYGVQDEDKRWYCRGFGCQVGEADGSGFCADAERRTKDEDTL